MFSGQLPHYIEPRKLAEQGGSVSGQTTVSALPRLAEFGHSQGEQVDVALAFQRSAEDSLYTVQGTVNTRLQLVCQRCLEPVMYDITARVGLALIWSEEDAERLPERFDPWLMSDEKLSLVPLLEEELLLALPLVAMHEQCPNPLRNTAAPTAAETETPKEQADNPFAILATLKKDRQE